ncbi:16S rRNA pseudouridine(516) synthase, partial [Vibrio parahaemolyticus]|nr:16S rRNA pseudouridine(516) synthase [Vibrio parahaemolyticus]NMS47471.1 16S rRNA pseudouridine(516) synthase [Vibrio parahaemolyticus]
RLEIVNEAENEVLLTIVEGKYHQVKRMFAALGNKVEYLHRERIGSIELDEALEPGDYRHLTQEEIDSIWN